MALSDELSQQLRRYRKAKRSEDLQTVLASLAGVFRGLRTKDAAQAFGVMQDMMPKLQGMSAAEKADAIEPLVKQLSSLEQKRTTEYGDLLKGAVDTQKQAIQNFINQLGDFARASSSVQARKINADIKMMEAVLKDMEQEDKPDSQQTNAVARAIIKSAIAESKEDGVVDNKQKSTAVRQKAEDMFDSPNISNDDKIRIYERLKADLSREDQELLKNSYAETMYNKANEDAKKAQARNAIIEDTKQKYGRRGAGTTRLLAQANAKLNEANLRVLTAVKQFQQEAPQSELFQRTPFEKATMRQIEEIQAQPGKGYASEIAARQISGSEAGQQAISQAGSFKDLFKQFKQEEKARRKRRRQQVLPAPPQAVYGAETQVADVTEKEDVPTDDYSATEA